MRENISKIEKQWQTKKLIKPQVAQGAHNSPAPQNPPPPQNPQIPLIPNAPQVPPELEAPHLSTPLVPLLNWSHFKPQYSGKPDEDIEAHLLRTNDWMDTQISGPW